MSSEAITQNDLREILSRTVGSVPSEYRKLLWANPSPSASFGATTIDIGASKYDDIEIVATYVNNDSNNNMQFTSKFPSNASLGATLAPQGGGRAFGSRKVTISGDNISFGQGWLYYATTESANNNVCVPLKIYGIKYERVQPPVIDADVEVLDAKATLFRIGRIRVLKLDKFKISNGLTIPSADRPQSTQSGTATRIWSDNETYGAVALLYVNADGTVVASYWGTYNNSSGASVATGDDRITGTVFWYVTE